MFLEKATNHYRKYHLNMMLTLLVCNLALLLFSSPKVFAVNTSIAITGNATINQATPAKDGTNYFRSLNVNVKTDSDTGYELYISGGAEDSALSSTDPLNTFKINSVSGNNNFIDDMENQYGYNIEDNDNHYYNYIPKLSTPALLVTTQDASEDNYKLNIGMRLDRKVPSGDYQGKIVFTVLSEQELKAKIVTGREFNVALRHALGVTDPAVVSDPETQIPAERKYYPDLTITVGRKKCSSDITPEKTVKISTPDSEADVYMGIYRSSWDNICIWSKATEMIFPEDLSYMFAGLTGTGYNLNFSFNDGRTSKLLNFSKVNNISHMFNKTRGWDDSTIDISNFTPYLKDSPVKNIESAFEDSTISNVGDISFAKHANNITRAFRNTENLSAADLSSWEISEATDATSVFENSAISTIDLSKSSFKNTTSTANMFKDSKAGSIDLSKATFDKVTDASYMFTNSQASTIDFTNTNFKEVENAKSMFENAQISSLDLKHVKFDKVKDFSNFFKNTTSLTEANLSSIKFTNAEDLSSMFADSHIANLTLNSQDMDGSHITNMASMFEGCYYVKEVDLGRIRTDELTAVKSMFKGAANLEKITLPQVFNTSKITDFSYMFAELRDLTEINNIDKLDTTSALDMSHMFVSFGVPINTITPLLKATNVKDLSYMFYDARIRDTVTFSPLFNTSSVVTMESMFEGASVYPVDLSNFSFASVENMSKMFKAIEASNEGKECNNNGFGPSEVTWPSATQNAPALTTLKSLFHGNCNITKIKPPKITAPNLKDTSFAFSGLGEITEVDLTGFDTSAVENMQAMFSGNSYGFMKDQHIKISLNTSNVKNMSKLFFDTYVSYLDLSDLDVHNVTDFSSTFDYTWLYEVDLTNWDTSSATDMSNMFNSSTWITKIYASDSFVTTNVTKYNNIFGLGDSYRGQAGSRVPASSIAHARIDGGSAAPGAFWRK